MVAVHVIEIALLAAAFSFLGYLLLVTLLASRARLRHSFAAVTRRKFAVIVPAHNEEAGIAATLRSIAAVAYPRALVEIVVVADNCTDATAARARNEGARVVERREPGLRGKGYALRYGFDRLLASEAAYDAFVVIDADSVVSTNFLSVMNWYLEHGSSAVQSSDLVDPGNTAWSAQMTRVGFLLYNYVRPLGRRVLGGTAGLRGNGMCFSASVLKEIPWEAYSVNEDLEYGTHLLLRGVNVTFAPEATVLATMPAEANNARSQRARWEGGRFHIMRLYALRLLGRALGTPSLACLDAFVDLVMPALTNLVGAVLAAGFLTLILALAGVPAAGLYALLWGVAAAAGGLHLFIGLRVAGADPAAYVALAHLPRYALWKLSVYAGMPGRWSRNVWARTAREN